MINTEYKILGKTGVIIAVFVFCLSGVSYAQDISEEIAKINTEIERLEEQLNTPAEITLAGNVVIRSKPGIRSQESDLLGAGDTIYITGIRGRYFHVEYDDGKMGYVSNDLQKSHPQARGIRVFIDQTNRDIEALSAKKRDIRRNGVEQIQDQVIEDMTSYNTNISNRISFSSQVMGILSGDNGSGIQDKHCPWYEVKVNKTDYLTYRSEVRQYDPQDDRWIHESLESLNRVRKLTLAERQAVLRRRAFVENNPGIDHQYRIDILKGTVRKGMTREMVMAARGEPLKINRAVTSRKVSEHWVYGSDTNRVYVFIRDGMLTAFHE
ncbi:MAG: hypothetical protein WD266_00045 [Balneolales bacterium]